MKKIKKKDLYIIIGGVLVALVIIWSIISWQAQNPGKSILNLPPAQNENQQANPDNSTPAETGAVTPAPAETPEPSLSYGEALKLYEGKRFQFGLNNVNNCMVTPYSSVFKKGVKVMLDNRIGKQITIRLDNVPYTISAYGFRIITLTTSAQLPHTISIDCETGQNNGQIILQQ